MTNFKPMLAAAAKPDKITFPILVQEKLDGIRCSIVDGKALTRTLKEVPNREIFNFLSNPKFEGLDGELVVGPPQAADAYRTTVSFVMASDKVGEDWCFYVFDKWDEKDESYLVRKAKADNVIREYTDLQPFRSLDAYQAETQEHLDAYETGFVEQGAEGVILRKDKNVYKFGRGSVTKGDLLKLKRFADSEAEIIGFVEELKNNNEAKKNALGRTERSTVKANKVGKGTLGALIVKDLNTGVEFQVGTGFDADQRRAYWQDQDRLLGTTVKYKSFTVGVKDKPRHPVFLGFRDMEIDG